MPARIIFPSEQIAELVEKYQNAAISTRDLAREYGVAINTINRVLREAGVIFAASNKISAKAKGRQSARKGYKFTDKERERSKILATGNKWCVGRVISAETRQKMSDSMARRNARWAEEGRLLTPEEKAARNHVRQTAKRFITRILTMVRIRKDKRTEALLGYTKHELRSHLESQFTGDMSWMNRGSFHVDHIIPIAYFLRNGITDFSVINALSNLQVLTPSENQRKSAAFLGGRVTYSQGIA